MTDVFDDLDAATLTIGDPITYTPAGGEAATFNAFVDHSPSLIDYGFSSTVTAEAVIQVRKIDVPAWEKAGDRILLPRTGRIYRLATEALLSPCGRWWNMAIVKAPA